MTTTDTVDAQRGEVRKNENDVDIRVGAGHRLTERLTAEAQRLLNFAAWIGAHQIATQGQLNFLSPFIALLANTDRVSRALQRVAAHGKLSAAQIAAVSSRQLLEWRQQSVTALPTTHKPVFTTSAEDVLTAAHSLANELSGPDRAIEIRHIVAGYIYTHHSNGKDSRHRPHDGELIRLGLDLEKASRGLIAIVEERHPEEAPAWRTRHFDDFGTPLPPTISARIVRDYWTAEDTLGYGAYARAIALFLTHRQTREPLCVSIQAPWGAGKTSLMALTQHSCH